MDSKILLGKILQRFCDAKITKVTGYNSFGYIKETGNAVYVTRENGKDTRVSYEKVIIGIEAYKIQPTLYKKGPSALRDFGITHVTSPIWSLLHLLEENDYK
ncbi:MAG: hypothetical protein EOO46_10535 [Flavobacterium sp.]|nr:MAG: hypothetical protein EOO46_10535 [Flavobacterium sp.]